MREKIKANSQRPHLLNLWVQHPMHLSVIYTTFFPVSILETRQPCVCIVMGVASDSAWPVWIECQRENLKWSAMELPWSCSPSTLWSHPLHRRTCSLAGSLMNVQSQGTCCLKLIVVCKVNHGPRAKRLEEGQSSMGLLKIRHSGRR